jgi:hypothetical protein
MTDSARLSFEPGQEQVEAMMVRGLSFSTVEDANDAAELSGRHKAALWLLAWSLRGLGAAAPGGTASAGRGQRRGYRHDG